MRLTQRVFWRQIERSEGIGRLLAFLRQRRRFVDELSYFTETDGGDLRWLPPAEVQRRAAILTDAVRRTRQAGFDVAINVLHTMGHSDDGDPRSPSIPWQGFTDEQGRTARQCSCPGDPAFLEYVRFKYAAFAGARASLYWIDDDLRMNNHRPADRGCFCPRCIDEFGRLEGATGAPAQREDLVQWLREASARADAWQQFGANQLAGVVRAAVQGIQSVQPDAQIGLMTCQPDRGLDAMMAALRDARPARVWQRPGGGFWDESSPRTLLSKVVSVNVQRAAAHVREAVTYEVENYPYCPGAKSARTTAIECLWQILAGRLDGIMFNVLDAWGNPLDDGTGWFDRLASWGDKLREAGALVADRPMLGWEAAPGVMSNVMEWRCTGVPLCLTPGQGAGIILDGHATANRSADDLARWLDRPVWMDGQAAAHYVAAGLGPRIGLRRVERWPGVGGVVERFTAHPLNDADGRADYVRGFSLPYFDAASDLLHPAEEAQVLSEAVSTTGDRVGAAFTLFAPPGRPPIAVMGHAPWIHLLSPPRMRQFRRLSERMLGDLVPVRISSPHAAVLVCRAGNGGEPLVIVGNPTADSTDLAVDCGSREPRPVFASDDRPLQTTRHVIHGQVPAWGVVAWALSLPASR